MKETCVSVHINVYIYWVVFLSLASNTAFWKMSVSSRILGLAQVWYLFSLLPHLLSLIPFLWVLVPCINFPSLVIRVLCSFVMFLPLLWPNRPFKWVLTGLPHVFVFVLVQCQSVALQSLLPFQLSFYYRGVGFLHHHLFGCCSLRFD